MRSISLPVARSLPNIEVRDYLRTTMNRLAERRVMCAETLTTADVQEFIDDRGLQASLISGIGHTPTVPAAADALGVHPDQIVKTLLFMLKTDAAPSGEREPLVVISNGTNRVDKKPLAQRFSIGKRRVQLAAPEVVLEVLGYPAGGVPPFAHRNTVPVIVDQSVVDLQQTYDGVIYAGGGDDTTMMKLSVAELLEVVQPEILAVS